MSFRALVLDQTDDGIRPTVQTLAHVIAEMRYGGSVAARGNTAVNFGAATSVIGLEELPDAGAKILAGQVRGRVIVDTSR
jgi:hypothetical protein